MKLPPKHPSRIPRLGDRAKRQDKNPRNISAARHDCSSQGLVALRLAVVHVFAT
jgi:hypothetical protein